MPRIVCWPRLGFGRDETIAALQNVEGIELRVALTLPEVLPLLHDADAMVLHSAPPEMARTVLGALAGSPLRWLHFLTAGRDGFEAAGLSRDYVVTQVPAHRHRRWPSMRSPCCWRSAGACPRHSGSRAIGAGIASRWAVSCRSKAAPWRSSVPAPSASRSRSACARSARKAIGISRSGSPHAAFDEMRPVAQLRDVLARCSAVVVAVPLTDATKHLLDAAALASLPKGAFVVNIARGAVLDQAALCAALESGHLGGAALDVTDPEPPAADDRLWSCPPPHPHAARRGRRQQRHGAAAGRRHGRERAPLRPRRAAARRRRALA